MSSIKLKLKNNLYRSKSFWLAKKWFENKPIFLFWKTLYKGNYELNKTRNYSRIFWPTLPSFVGIVVYSIFIIFIFEFYNRYLPVDVIFDSNGINAFLIAIASISGIFLGLYFTAISGIASNYLLRAPQDVKRFFLTEPRGYQYVRTITITAVISIFYILASKILGITIHPVGIAFLSILAAYIVIRFWQVGTDVFYALEPQYALPWITKNIFDSTKQVTPPSFQWSQPAIQNHHRKLTTANLELINNLISFGKQEMKVSDEQLITAIRYIGGLMFVYSDLKSKIPTNSLWYEIKNQFQNWAFASSTEIVIALNTGTPINPKVIKSYTWFEEKSLDTAVEILKNFIVEKKTAMVLRGHEVFADVVESYGKNFDEQSLKLLLKKLEDVNYSIYSIKPDETQQHIYKEQLAFIDSQGRLAIAAVLGLSKYLDKKSCKEITNSISNIRWLEPGNIYAVELPATILSRLESIAKDLGNEKIIEGKIVSKEWYIQTLCVQQYLFSLQKYFEYLKSLHADYFQPKLDKLLTENQLVLAVQLIQRWIEFTKKYSRLVYIIKKHVEEYSKFHYLKDLPWPDFRIDDEVKNASEREREVVDKLIQLLPKLKILITGDDLPDYFGQALVSGIEACYESCENNTPERLKKILPAVFDASLAAYEKTSQKVQEWSEEESKIIYSTEPLVNLFEISGYAKLYSELYQNKELWEVIKNLWDIYLTTVDAKKVIKFIVAIASYRATIFKIMPQAMLRSNWQIAFNQKMRERGLPVFPDRDSYDFVNDRRSPNHVSPLIRAIARSGGLMGLNIGQEVFFATYLSHHEAAEDIEFLSRRDLSKRIQREEQKANYQNEDNG
jgi:hypothetical protein